MLKIKWMVIPLQLVIMPVPHLVISWKMMILLQVHYFMFVEGYLKWVQWYSAFNGRRNGTCSVQRVEHFSTTIVPFPASESAVVR
jgi:hypothetical protein